MSTLTEQRAKYLESFDDLLKRSAGPGWLRSLREEAYAQFSQLGFPTLRTEDWRFTSVAAIAEKSFTPAAEGRGQLSARALKPFRVGGLGAQLVFVNGRFARELSVLGSLPHGVKAGSLAQAIATQADVVESHLGRYAEFRDDAFTALNTAFIQDGAFINVPRGTIVEHPIAVLFVSIGDAGPQMVHPRNLIIVGEDSQVSVIEDYVSINTGVFFGNIVTELVAGDAAVVSHYMLEREDEQAYNISTLRTHQGRSANLASHSVLLGGALVRNNVHPVLAGEGGDCLINGLFIGRNRQHMDNYMKVEHASPHCGSRQFYNGILDDYARGVFHGRIIVHKDAQKTDAKQTNRNLLLSDNAQIDTKPQLEIYADDVKCTHGATIGQISEEALFYMRSRGLEEKQARALLLFAFASESLERMKPGPVREYLEKLVPQWLPNGGTR
ncbi:MAG: Fe-S cluster assembly protein SufD [Terriglobales bacterium]